MGKEQIIDYVMNSPANTNKAVLEGMLDGMGGADVPTPTVEDAGKVLGVNENGKYSFNNVDCGFSCTEEWVTLTDESVTTTHPEDAPEGYNEGTLQGISEDITATSLRITFDGTQYICPRYISEDDDACYGATFTYGEQGIEYDWSEYPFAIIYDGTINTQTVGTHTVKIEEMHESIETSECFEKAIRNSIKVYKVSMLASTSRTVDPQERVSNYSTFEYRALDADGNEVDFSTLDYDVIMLKGFQAHGLIIEKCELGFMTLFNPSTSTTTRPIIDSANTGAYWVAIKL